MTEQDMYEKSFERPNNFWKLKESERWQIDKVLGILDWVGGNLTNEEIERYNKHYE